jgi:DNA-binding MarR family transcriptional regulator
MNSINDTATYQVQSFISKQKHLDFNLSAYEIVILYTIARYLDMPKKKCCAKQVTLAKDCGMSTRQFKRSSQKLSDNGLIIRTMRGKLYHYYLGFGVTNEEFF